MNTSGPGRDTAVVHSRDSASGLPAPLPPSVPSPMESGLPVLSGPPTAHAVHPPEHFGNVLFLSADSKLVYAYVGVLKALEEYHLQPDAMLAESKAVIIGAFWALGYPTAKVEDEFRHRPLEAYLTPSPALEGESDRPFLPSGPDFPQWEIPLSVQSLQ
ncbi:MAG: hypothetical protein ABIY63_15630, partial [Fibrobacteria bacterium]